MELIVVSFDPDVCALIESMPSHSLTGVIDLNDGCASAGIAHLGGDDDWLSIRSMYPNDRIIMAIDDCSIRKRQTATYGLDNFKTLIAPDAWISPTVKMGQGCIVQMGCKISRSVVLGDICKINMDVTIHHDTVIGNACTLAPGCRLLGNVTLEDDVHIGSGAIILPRLTIAQGTVVGAGALVTRDTSPGEVVVGNPAHTL